MMNRMERSSRGHLFRTCLLTLAVLIGGCEPHSAARPERAVKGPWLQDLKTDDVTVFIEAAQPGAATLKIRPAPPDSIGKGSVEGPGTWRKVGFAKVVSSRHARGGAGANGRVLYSVSPGGLKPGGRYEYRVLYDGEDVGGGHFGTLVKPGTPFRFVAYGDTRSLADVHHRIANAIARTDPLFVLHTGDLVADGTRYADWSPQWFEPAREMLMNAPVYPVLGNHEFNASYYYRYFRLPGDAQYYWSFDCGDLHVIGIDPWEDWSPHGTQVKWLSKDIDRSRARWKILVVHYPPFSRCEGHYSDLRTRKVLQPVLRDHPVDIVLAGHNHAYERTRPLVNRLDAAGHPYDRNSGSAPKPVIHVVTGGGGAPSCGVAPAWWTAAAKSTPHFCVFEVTPETLTMTVHEADGTVIDHLKLGKGGEDLEKDLVYVEDIEKDETERPTPRGHDADDD